MDRPHTTKVTQWIIALSIIAIFTPFIYMKIGPKGIEYYGKNVPDIYIFGGYILGKDTSFWGINFAYKLQLFAILVYTALIYSFKRLQKSKILMISLLLLIFFPFWLVLYVQGVKNNSDTADLTIYPMPGLIIWAVILILNLWTLLKHYKKSIKTTAVWKWKFDKPDCSMSKELSNLTWKISCIFRQ